MAKFSPPMAWLGGITMVGLCSLGAAMPTKALVVANYEFQNTLSSTIPTAPDLVPFAPGTYAPAVIGGIPTIVYNFGANKGLSLDTTGLLSDNYTIAALFSFDNIAGYKKIFDFKNLTSDTGLYTLNGRLIFYSTGTGCPAVDPGTFFEAVLTRDSTTDLVSVYLNGAPVFSFTDSSSLGVISGANLLNIFQDDFAVPGEITSGSVAGLRIFNNVLTDTEVADLDLLSPPGPPTAAVPAPLPILGAAAALGFSRKLRKRISISRSPISAPSA